MGNHAFSFRFILCKYKFFVSLFIYFNTSVDVCILNILYSLVSSSFSMLVLFGILIFMWFFAGRNQKKREKEAAELKKNIEIGDEIVTIGGIVGIVVGIVVERAAAQKSKKEK